MPFLPLHNDIWNSTFKLKKKVISDWEKTPRVEYTNRSEDYWLEAL